MSASSDPVQSFLEMAAPIFLDNRNVDEAGLASGVSYVDTQTRQEYLVRARIVEVRLYPMR